MEKKGSQRVRRMSRQLSRKFTQKSMGGKERRLSNVSWQSFKTALSGWGSKRGSRAADFEIKPVTVSSVRELVLAEIEDRYESSGRSLDKENNYRKVGRQVSFGGVVDQDNNVEDAEFHIKDIDRIRHSDHFIQRYIDDANAGNKVGVRICDKQVVDAIIDVLKWRKEFGINDYAPTMFPREFFEAGTLRLGHLVGGDTMFYVVGRKYKKVDGWSDVIIDLLLWKFDEVEISLKEGAKVRFFVDATGCGLSQADTGLLFKGVPILISYYPGAVSKAYFYQVPWLLKPFAQVALSLLPQKFKDLICFVESKTGIAQMGEENIPDFMGGPVVTENFPIPQGISSVEQVGAARGLNKNNIAKMKKMVEAVMKEK